MKDTIKIFSETGCISHETLWRYRQGKLSTKEKHEVELHLTDCELCSDALAGMTEMDSDKVINELRKSVRNISAPKKIIRFSDFRMLAAAAAVAVFFIFMYVINSSDKNQNKEIVLLTSPAKPEKADSLSTRNFIPVDDPKLLENKSEDLSLAKNVSKASADKNESAGKVSSSETAPSISEEHQLASQANLDKAEPDAGYIATTTSAREETQKSTEDMSAAPPAAAKENRTPELIQVKTSVANKKSASSQTKYFHDLKVASVPAMAPAENFDSVNTGTPAQYENKDVEESEKSARELPFMYSKTLKDGIGYYKSMKYAYAILTFDIILERFPKDINAIFYKALSEMESQNFSDASSLFKKVVNHSDKTFLEEAKFKLAVCLAAVSKTDESKKLFEEIISEKGFYAIRAKEELGKLK
jgi:TolA-binding protein